MSTLKDFFEGKTKEFKPVGYFDNDKVYNMEDYVELEKVKSQAEQNGIALGNFERPNVYDDNGNLLETPRDSYVINEDITFINKVKVNEDNTINVVTDYRAIMDQRTGLIYTPSVVSYKIGREGTGKKAELKVLSTQTVPAQEFIDGYIDTLETSDASKIYEVITHNNQGNQTGLKLDDLFA